VEAVDAGWVRGFCAGPSMLQGWHVWSTVLYIPQTWGQCWLIWVQGQCWLITAPTRLACSRPPLQHPQMRGQRLAKHC
jgi:hypothetical protein